MNKEWIAGTEGQSFLAIGCPSAAFTKWLGTGRTKRL